MCSPRSHHGLRGNRLKFYANFRGQYLNTTLEHCARSWVAPIWEGAMGNSNTQCKNGHPPPTILVVEDEPLVRLLIVDYLRSVGYLVIEAGSADEAVAAISAGARVHLVFSDVGLPGMMGGFSFAVWIRNHYRSIPVILTSGVSSAIPPLNRQHLIPFLPKPYQPQEAADLIATVLTKSPLTRDGEPSGDEA